MNSFGITDRGLVREVNEDELFRSDSSVGCLPNLYIVADGMGGHNAGEVASRNCARYLIDYIESADIDTDVEQLFYDAIDYANEKIYTEGRDDANLKGMGTTLVLCTVFAEDIYVANVGDSRLYKLNGGIEQVTVDHSVVEELYRAGHISEVEKNHHPDKNMITRAMGVEGTVDADFFSISRDGLRYVLICSDGLTKMVSDVEMGGIFEQHRDVEGIVNALKNKAVEHGGRDNVTVIVVALEGEVGQ